MNTPHALQSLLEHMSRNGCRPAKASDVVLNGKKCRFRIAGDKPNSKNGEIEGRLGESAYATYRTYKRSGDRHRWTHKDVESLPEPENAMHSELADRQERINQQKLSRRHKSVANKARRLFDEYEPLRKHKYLVAKGLSKANIDGLASHDDRLVVPLRDINGKLWSLQRIDADGSKRFDPGGRTTGCYFHVGKPITWRVIIAEGLATAMSLNLASGIPCLASMSARNLMHVAKAVREKHPRALITLAADDDAATLLKSGRNPGIEASEAAARAIGGVVAYPRRNGVENMINTDFNDLLHKHKTAAVRRALKAAVAVPKGAGPQFRPVEAACFVKEALEPRIRLLGGWLWERGAVMLHSSAGVGKTHLNLAIAAHLVTGRPLFDWSVDRAAGVLLIDGEMGQEELQERLRAALAGTGGKQKRPLQIVTPDRHDGEMPDLGTPGGLDALEAHLGGIDLVIIDSITTLFNFEYGENDSRSWLPVLRFLKRMKQLKRAVIVSHHDSKQGTARGFSGSLTPLDATLQLKATRKEEAIGAQFRIELGKNRGGCQFTPIEVALSEKDGKYTWHHEKLLARGEARAKVPGVAKRRLSRLTEEQEAEIRTLHACNKSVRDIAAKTGVPKTTVDRFLKS